MSQNPYRRAQLITTFGVGALNTTPNGTSVICCGLDHWFKSNGSIDLNEFIIREWRLERQLRVNHFRKPPDFRHPPRHQFASSEVAHNLNINIPTLRFPTWHFCSYCRSMTQFKPHTFMANNCEKCEKKGGFSRLIQVQFVTVCTNGHIDEFPWFEWAHQNKNNISCNREKPDLKLRDKGASSLEGLSVECQECKAKKSLSQSLGKVGSNTLTSKLIDISGNPLSCRGSETWNYQHDVDGCGRDLIGSLRSASDIYYSKTKTSIFVPRDEDTNISKIINLLNQNQARNTINIVEESGGSVTPKNFRNILFRGIYDKYTNEQIQIALNIVLNKSEETNNDINEVSEEEFRRPEYLTFLKNNNEDQETLYSEIISSEKYQGNLKNYFESIGLVKKLTETKTLYSFTRKELQSEKSIYESINLLWKNRPSNDELWLPAVQVGGEGIFLKFNEDMINQFENNIIVQERISSFIQIPRPTDRPIDETKATVRYMLLHTFAHILINTLIFECGYGASSLQERVYCSNNEGNSMAGILIYTAAGDSSGTMGGLVRMGQPQNFEKIFEKALENAMWCSIDPICMELSEYGQGPNSLNMAGCHNCALIPETACESFNSYLDRALICGSIANKDLGFFK